MFKIDADLQFLKDDRFSSLNVNMAKIYERLLSTNILREVRRDSFDPQRKNLLGEDSICMVNLLGTPRVIVFFFYYMLAFRSVSHVLDRDKTRSLGNKML